MSPLAPNDPKDSSYVRLLWNSLMCHTMGLCVLCWKVNEVKKKLCVIAYSRTVTFNSSMWCCYVVYKAYIERKKKETFSRRATTNPIQLRSHERTAKALTSKVSLAMLLQHRSHSWIRSLLSHATTKAAAAGLSFVPFDVRYSMHLRRRPSLASYEGVLSTPPLKHSKWSSVYPHSYIPNENPRDPCFTF